MGSEWVINFPNSKFMTDLKSDFVVAVTCKVTKISFPEQISIHFKEQHILRLFHVHISILCIVHEKAVCHNPLI